MRTIVTARHCEISDELRAKAETIMEKFVKLASRPLSAEVIFDADHGEKVVELKLSLPRGQVKVAKAEAVSFRSALDRAADKIRRQLDKEERRSTHRSTVE
ncbi:MAG: ribosome-associated translation inhibitor RaiA [Gemmatimonadota bacterium]|nr:MAG: ribosome-associated translation inhibitor RaiA [Gemmatimonadota bacterium]